MYKLFLILLLLAPCINITHIELDHNPLRYPASSTSDAIDSIKKICDDSRENDPSFVVCSPYANTKTVFEKQSQRYVKVITDNVPEPVTAVSGFVLKSLYEKQVKVEVKTGIGDPSVSFSNIETNWGWKFNYSF